MNIKKIFSYKLDEFRYAKDTNNLIDFIMSNKSKEGRRIFYEKYKRRGVDMCLSMGLKVPADFPIDSLNEVFFEKIYDVIGYIPKATDIVIDVGAHTGDWTVYCAKVLNVKNIYAFEPLKDNIKHAKSILDLNDCNNSSLYEIGLSNSDKEIEIEYDGNMMGKLCTNKNPKKESIMFKRLDSFDLYCDILKIDVEGFELEVLNGAIETIKKFRPRIILEVHSKKLRSECNKILEQEGYKLDIIGRKAKKNTADKHSSFDEVVNLFYSYKLNKSNS